MLVRRSFRLILVAVAAVALLAWGAMLASADATGGSPSDGIPVVSASAQVCSSITVPAGGQLWLKVEYHGGTDLEMYTQGAAGLSLAVYDPSQVTNWPTLPAHPTGLMTPNSNEPGYTSTWQGHAAKGQVSDYYYVLVSNSTGSAVTFSFCTHETAKFVPLSPNVVPTRCIIAAGDSSLGYNPCHLR
ncbi:MAG: hypothetical protein M1482_13460 [Chloroflexi bacterium]|nr:hypothetical protein [Chloroflexota bacterium]